jgi:hypothetical protein
MYSHNFFICFRFEFRFQLKKPKTKLKTGFFRVQLYDFSQFQRQLILKYNFKPFLSYNLFKFNVNLFIKTWNFHNGSILLFILVDQMFLYIESKCKHQSKKK